MVKEQTIIKKDTVINWSKAKNFIPKKGEIIVYSDLPDGINMKIGDGISLINNLPFINNYKYFINENTLIIEGYNE